MKLETHNNKYFENRRKSVALSIRSYSITITVFYKKILLSESLFDIDI